MLVPQRNGTQGRTKASSGRTMMKTLELLQLAKRQSDILERDEAMLNSEKIKPVAIATLNSGIAKLLAMR